LDTEYQSHAFDIKVDCRYLEEQSRDEDEHFVFAYTIHISNNGDFGAKLLRRHWIITDADGKIQEVRGDGVVGEQPYIDAGESYQYTSGAVLSTPLGTMEGSYQMMTDDGRHFLVKIPLFSLTKPGVLN
jgi:ApaG protein